MINKMRNGIHFCSFEILPPRKKSEIPALLKSVHEIKEKCDPLFYALTCHLRDLPSSTDMIHHVFNFASAMKDQELLLHLAASELSENRVLEISSKAVTLGIKNFFALRGDKVSGEQAAFPHAVNLVSFLRREFGRKIFICVAGYPDSHPESRSYEDDLKHLKEKVDAGADFIITQITFDAEAFEHFVDKCREFGIMVPIIPGIMPIQSYASLERICRTCHVKIPKQMLDILEPIKDNDDLVQSFGVSYITDMAQRILSSKRASGIHFFTMNRVMAAIMICKNLGFGSQSVKKPLHLSDENKVKPDGNLHENHQYQFNEEKHNQ